MNNFKQKPEVQRSKTCFPDAKDHFSPFRLVADCGKSGKLENHSERAVDIDGRAGLSSPFLKKPES